MIQDPFSSPDTFRNTFQSGLQRLLEDEEGLGPFILALANATFDAEIHARLRHHLVRRFGELAERCRRDYVFGQEPNEPPDDLAVFLKLMAIGFDAIETRRQRSLGPWEVQFNQIRSLRPKRAAGRRPASIRMPFDGKGFHFNKPFLKKEIFWGGSLYGMDLDLLFNKFPFVDLHALLVPSRLDKEPQFLTRLRHRQVWDLCERLATQLPGIGVGYNSIGAFSSVNHLHFQTFLRNEPLPVVAPCWRHNGGSDPYPAHCERFEHVDSAWEYITGLQAREVSYNLIYLPGHLFCFPRQRQGGYKLPQWSGGHGWYEMAGGVVVFNAEHWRTLSVNDVQASLSATVVGTSHDE